jgi:hypothetical protein
VCSSGDPTADALEMAEAKMTTQLNQDYETTFGEQQQVLNSQAARLNYIAANPMGYTQPQLATATTNINENTATAARQAIGAASAYAAAHGGADVGSGAVGEIAGQISSAAAQSKAQQLSSLSQQNQAMKQQNFWNAIQGLNSVGSEYGGAGGTAISGAGSSAESSVNAGKLALESSQAGWQDVGGVISGIGGLATAASGFNFGGGTAATTTADGSAPNNDTLATDYGSSDEDNI